MKPEIKGYLFAFGASFALASSFIFSKAALNKTDMFLFGFTWFGIGASINLIWLVIREGKSLFQRRDPGVVSLALLIAAIEGLATVLFYIAIQKMENPAVVSFIGNLGPVLVTLMGIGLLGEKYTLWQLAGILISLAGVFMITFNIGTDLSSVFQPGSQYVLLASVLFAAATVIARHGKERLAPELMSTLRSLMLFIVFSGIIIFRGMEIRIQVSAWADIFFGSLLETLITIVFAYQALRYLEAARTSLIISSKAIWLVLMAWIFLDTFPLDRELIGGILSLAGIALISIKKRQRSS